MDRSPPPPPTFREWLFYGPNRVVVLFIVGLLAVVVWGMLPGCGLSEPARGSAASVFDAQLAAAEASGQVVTLQVVRDAAAAAGRAAAAEAAAQAPDSGDVAVASGIGTAILLALARAVRFLLPMVLGVSAAPGKVP